MSNYPDGFNTRLLIEDELPENVQDDLGRIHAAHAEIMSAIREMLNPNFPVPRQDVVEFLTTVDQMFGELVTPIYKEVEAEYGTHVTRPVTPEYAQWLMRQQFANMARYHLQTNPQTHIDVAAANAAAAASVFDGEAVA